MSRSNGFTNIITLKQYKRLLNPWGRKLVNDRIHEKITFLSRPPARDKRSEMRDREYFDLYKDPIFYWTLLPLLVVAWIWKMRRQHSSGNAHGHSSWFFGAVNSYIHIGFMIDPRRGPEVDEANFVCEFRTAFDRLESELKTIDSSAVFAPEQLSLFILHKMLQLSISEIAIIFGYEEQGVQTIVGRIQAFLDGRSCSSIEPYQSIETRLPRSSLFLRFQY